MPGLPVHHQLLEYTQTHAHQVSDAIQPSHPLSSPSLPAFNLSHHQGLFKLVSSLHQVAKVLDIGVLISFQIKVLSEYLPKSEITESYGSLFLAFEELPCGFP